MTAKAKNIIIISALGVLGALLTAAAFFLIKHGYLQDVIHFIESDISPLLFVLLLIFLPLAGFPISIFLIISGVKFGIPATIMLWLLILPIHTMLCYAAAKNLRPLLVSLLKDTLGYTVPAVAPSRQAIFSFIFLIAPGLPYAAKNYILPLAGVAFRYCVVMNCIVQSAMGMPFIILGKSGADKDPTLLYIAIFFFVALFLAVRWLHRRYSDR